MVTNPNPGGAYFSLFLFSQRMKKFPKVFLAFQKWTKIMSIFKKWSRTFAKKRKCDHNENLASAYQKNNYKNMTIKKNFLHKKGFKIIFGFSTKDDRY